MQGELAGKGKTKGFGSLRASQMVQLQRKDIGVSTVKCCRTCVAWSLQCDLAQGDAGMHCIGQACSKSHMEPGL